MMKRRSRSAARVRTPQQARARKKVDRVLAAARHCFSGLGYEKTNIPRIARRAGVSTGTVYSYFRDKDDVLVHILNEHAVRMLGPAEEVMRTLPGRVGLRAMLERLARIGVEAHQHDPELDALMHMRALRGRRMRLALETVRERATAICQALVNRYGGAIPADRRRAAAQVISGLFESCAHMGLLHSSRARQQRVLSVAMDMIEAYLVHGGSGGGAGEAR